MRKQKRKRLEAKGWKIGTVKEFLALSDEESAYIELKVKLAAGLKQRRQQQGLSQLELAAKLQSSQSRVAKMEAGDPSVTIDLLLKGLILLGVTRSEIARVLVFEEPKPLFTTGTVVATTHAMGEPGIYWPQYVYRDDKRVTIEQRGATSAPLTQSGSTGVDAPNMQSALSH